MLCRETYSSAPVHCHSCRQYRYSPDATGQTGNNCFASFFIFFRGLGEPHKLGFINNLGRGYLSVPVTVSIAQPYIAQMVFVLVHVKVRIVRQGVI